MSNVAMQHQNYSENSNVGVNAHAIDLRNIQEIKMYSLVKRKQTSNLRCLTRLIIFEPSNAPIIFRIHILTLRKTISSIANDPNRPQRGKMPSVVT